MANQSHLAKPAGYVWAWMSNHIPQKSLGWNYLSMPLSQINHINYSDVIMSAIASQTTSLTIVYSTVYSGAYRRKHQSSASLAFVRGIHRSPVNSPHKGPVTQKMFPFDDVIMQQKMSDTVYDGLRWCHLWPLLLTWFNFNPSMDM